MMEYKTMKIDDIIDWCQANAQVDWLKELAATPIVATDKNGVEYERKITFIEIKMAFAEKFLPDIAPKKQPKKPSMFERIANL